MQAQTFFIIIISIIILEFVFDKFLDFMNRNSWETPLPDALKDLYDAEKYQKAKEYAKANGRLSLLSGLLSLAGILFMLFFEGFGKLDAYVSSLFDNKILQTLVFFAFLTLASSVIQWPFGIYKTFVIEEKYGFNKTTVKTYILDKLKGFVLGALIGGLLLGTLTWVFYAIGEHFWWIAWLLVTGFSLFFASFYTSIIVPIFNKLEPLTDGSLRSKIENYAEKVTFPLQNIMVIDGSKRSSKANAFFSGLGKTKAIVLYDTLIEDHTEDELTAILAHEVGHYKKKHIQQSLVLGVLQTGLLFFLFGFLANSEALSASLGASDIKFHIALIGFSLIYSPISMLLGIFMNYFSRKNEFEADAFARETFNGEDLVNALKKLSVKHLSNLTPHPWYVFVHYSHPPLAERVKSIQNN
jgi:STE24 endopeptidase